jgi:hypothetical protein
MLSTHRQRPDRNAVVLGADFADGWERAPNSMQ